MQRARTLTIISTTLLAVLVSLLPAAAQEEPETSRRSDNVSFVAHDQYPQGTDLFFQRRDGRQRVDGRTVNGTRDYLFAGADASAAGGQPPDDGFVGVRIYDVTDPTSPTLLTAIDCPGYHADVAVYENLLVQAIDSASTNRGCADAVDPDGKDRADVAGVRIYDISDPARPVVAGFVDAETLGTQPHNITTLPWAGALYVAGSEFTPNEMPFVLPVVDLTDPSFPATVVPINDITPNATAECHDIGLDPERELAFCAAVEQTFVWDVSDPFAPTTLATIVNPNITIHHAARLAPDGTTLVLNDELGGAAAAPGCAPTTADTLGALWFYDLTDPTSPSLQGSFSTSEASAENPCTSHFYNFVPGTTLLTVGWYKSGVIVVDYADPSQPIEHAFYEPVGGDFWTAYYWNGYVFGSSFGGEGTPDYGGDFPAGGLWVLAVDDLPTVAPSVYDQGTSWAPWAAPGPSTPADEAPDELPTPAAAPAGDTLPTTGGGSLAVLVGALLAVGALAFGRRLVHD